MKRDFTHRCRTGVHVAPAQVLRVFARLRTVAAYMTLAATTLFSAAAVAQEASSFRAKQITIYVGFSATSGIGYDTYARVLGQVLGKYIPGKPTVVVSNKPGGGSMTAANYIAQVAAKDGSEIAMVGRGVGMDRLVFGAKSAAQFDATKMNWLGSMNNEVSGFFISDTAPVKSLEDVLAGKPFIVGSAGVSSDLHIFSIVTNAIFGSRMKIVSGYPGTNEILLSLERGEVDGLLGYSWAAARTGSAEMLRSGKLKNIMQLGLRKHADLPDLPLVMDLVKNEDDRRVLELIFARQAMGRPLVAPPGTPPATVAMLRKAFMEAMRDPELIETARKLTLEIDAMPGEEVQGIVERLHGFPEAVIARTQALADAPAAR
ncbi:MAG: tripartite tricarboxylate transporter substrate-binding protein [Beijerinckiaceae bacterium]|nr:tripartite tricarboxylate transporter substrate-binding protein [Beijerinckiaceae bacterium]